MEKESFKFDWEWAFMDYETVMEQHLDRELKPNEKIMPTTRHVLHALQAYMDIEGYCFPSMKTLATKTGLTRQTVMTHISIAEKKGWLKIVKQYPKQKRELRQYNDKQWKRNTYQAVIPKEMIKAVKEVDHVSEGGQSDSEGGQSDSIKVVKEVYTNNNIIKKNKEVGVGFSFLGEKTSPSIAKEQFDALRQKLSPVANKKPKPSLEQRKAELKRQAEQILAEQEQETLLSEDFKLQPEISEHFYDIGGSDFDYLRNLFGKHKERLIKLKFKRNDWVEVFKRCFDEDKKSYPENYKHEKTTTRS